MDLLFEFIIELLLDGSIEISKNKKTPKYIRYPLIILISLFFIFAISLVFLTSIISFKINILLGIFLFVIALVMLIMSIIKFKKLYLEKSK